MKRENQTGKKRNYRYLISSRADSNLGPIRDHNEKINDLPEVGSYVIVDECHIYERTKGEQHVVSTYMPSNAYVDEAGFPVIFKVLKYTKGRENALDPKNMVVLERTIREGKADERKLETRLKAILVSTGSMYLEEVPKNFKFKTKDFLHLSCDELIVASVSTYNQRNIKNVQSKY